MKRLIALLICIFLIICLVPGAQCQQTVRILYVNDFHGFVDPHQPKGGTELLGGVAHLAGAVAQLRREKPTLLLAAGDMIQGSNWANLFYGQSVIDLMNLMKFDAMVVGNHEFDFGQEALRKRIAQARFPVLGANVEGFPPLKPYVLKELPGVKVAVVGVVTADTPSLTHPRSVAGLKFGPPEATLKKYAPELKKKADLLIVLAHLGHQAERRLAEKVSGIDLIIGGHSHTKVLCPVVVGNTVIVQAWEHGKALGVLDLTVKDGKIIQYQGRLEEIKPGVAKADPKVQKLVASYQSRLDARLNQTIGQAGVDLDGEKAKTKETNLGDLIADILKEAAGAEVAIINGGGLRASINKGPITVRDIYSALPHDNYLVAFRLTGQQIREALEHGVSGLEKHPGKFPQVSGLTFTYSRAAPPGARVKEILVNGQPLAPERKYLMATHDFLAAGGDGYTVFGQALGAGADYAAAGGYLPSKNLVYSDPGTWVRELVISYMKAHKTVAPEVAGRIKELE